MLMAISKKDTFEPVSLDWLFRNMYVIDLLLERQTYYADTKFRIRFARDFFIVPTSAVTSPVIRELFRD